MTRAASASDPRILVFSTEAISDRGIDLAGSAHMDYPATVQVLAVPCSSGIHPNWIVHALKVGFAGVFVAADGGDCAFVSDCTARTARVVEEAKGRLTEEGLDARRVRMSGICSVCAEPFVNHMRQFRDALAELTAPPPPA